MATIKKTRGVRDFLPEQKIARNNIVAALRKTFEKYGYNPLETPAIERLSTLTSKDEAESDVSKEIFQVKDQRGRKLGLRFDLTVPLSRVMATNRQLPKPFKRYQIGRAWRDGPVKKGRYKEFWSCDFDCVGAESIAADAEVLAIFTDVFKKLGLNVVIKVNNRKLINGILEYAGLPKKQWMKAIMSIDKLEKVGRDGVIDDAKERGIGSDYMTKILDILEQEGSNTKLLKNIKKFVGQNEGLKEIKEMLKLARKLGAKNVQFTPSLARGLAYYTGPVFEVFLKSGKFKSSLAGGGRFDGLIKTLSKGAVDYPATGAAFGLDTIYDALAAEDKLPFKKSLVQAYVVPIGVDMVDALPFLKQLRAAGINADIDLKARSPGRNFSYVDSQDIPYAVVVGSKELKAKKVTLKDMRAGKEKLVTVKQAIKIIQ